MDGKQVNYYQNATRITLPEEKGVYLIHIKVNNEKEVIKRIVRY